MVVDQSQNCKIESHKLTWKLSNLQLCEFCGEK